MTVCRTWPLLLVVMRGTRTSALPANSVRLDKLLADRGAGTRSDVGKLIRAGRVVLDGEVVGKSGGKLKVPVDTVRCNASISRAL